jgi:alkylated DNA repair dioxygenase AlkB
MSLLNNAFVTYESNFINGDEYFETFNNGFDWKYNNYNGHRLNRQTCVFADRKIIEDRKNLPKIWGDDVTVVEWTKELLQVKKKVEERVKELTGIDWEYNIALGNRYTKKGDFIAFHSDNEEIGSTQSIASLSFGIPRTFTFMRKDKGEKKSIILENGSLLFMGENCQENYLHGMKKESLVNLADEETLEKYGDVRINITFRVWNY